MFFNIIFPKRLWSIFMKCYILIIKVAVRMISGWLACSEMNVIIPFNQFNILIKYIDCVKDTQEKVFGNKSIVFDDTYSKYESLW